MTRIVLLKRNSYEISSGQIFGLDLSSYSDPDYISVTCPDMSDDIDLEESFIELTSNPDGEFTGSLASVSFADRLNEISLPGDTELRFAISDFNSIDLSNVTAVRFRIKALSTLVFQVMSVRAVSADWTYAPIDIDTIAQCVELPVSPTGDPEYPIEFPTQLDGLEFEDWPITWQDIYPKNFSVSAEIYTGSLEGENSISIFFRGANLNKGIVNDLEEWQGGSPAKMSDLNGLSLETDIADENSSSLEYLGSKITWSATDPLVTVFSNPDDEGDRKIDYSFERLSFEPDTRYMITFTNEKDSFRVRIHKLDNALGKIESLVFDSELMSGHLFAPRPGFFGWWSSLEDGDSFIDNIRHRHANFGDLNTRQFQSITPVLGVQLSHASSSPKSLINAFGAAPWGGLVSEDLLEPDTYNIISEGKMEGIQSNEFVISDWQNTDLNFEIKAAEGDYICYLLGANGNIIELDVSQTIQGEWKQFRFEFDGRPDTTGRYRLVIVKRTSNVKTTWQVRNVKASVKLIHWSARNQDDPWDLAPEEWTTFGETSNKTNSALMFKEPGYVQVKASLTNNDAQISEFHILPRYAQLGRLVFEEEDTEDVEHIASIVAEINKLSVNFVANIEYSDTDTRRPIGYIWIFDSTNEWYVGNFIRRKFTPGMHHAFLQVTYSDGSTQTDFWQAYLTP